MSEPSQRRREIAKQVRAMLVERFSACFRGRGEAKPPLMIGIRKVIAERCPDITDRDIGYALFDYTSGRTYLQSFVEGTWRIDLDGNPVSELTEGDFRDAAARYRRGRAAYDRTIKLRIRGLAAQSAPQTEEVVNG